MITRLGGEANRTVIASRRCKFLRLALGEGRAAPFQVGKVELCQAQTLSLADFCNASYLGKPRVTAAGLEPMRLRTGA